MISSNNIFFPIKQNFLIFFMMQISLFRQFRWISLILITVLLIVFILRLPATAEIPKNYKELEFPSLSSISLPDYERYELKNGMVVYLIEDHQLPLIKGNALIKVGSRIEPREKIGLAEITGSMMRLGGTTQHPASELNELLEQRAAKVEVSINTHSGNAAFNSLSKDIEIVFDLFSQVLKEPAFDSQQLVLTKTQLQGQIARRNDNPGDIANRELYKLVYGQDSPYARTIEHTMLNNIDLDDVISFHKQYIRPENLILGIVGDFDSKVMKQLIKNGFEDWESSTIKPEITIPQANQIKKNELFFIDQPHLNQSNVLLGHLGGKLDSPDYPALSVINGLLNGFGGRLFNNLRSDQGLAYTVYGYWNAAYDYPGVFLAGGQTSSETTTQFIESLIAEIELLRNQPINNDELAYAKESILNSFVFKFENPSQTLSRLLTYEYYGYPENFIFKYQEGIKKTTVEDIQRVAQQYLKTEDIVTLVVGSKENIYSSLSKLKKNIHNININTSPQMDN
ncbi:predicted Zn-dependent peptidase [Candidatus Atelocyanobacterium thalassa isolate ALOHA]|uniref:Predicted Zn-dependent peptidase n=2 Tax=Candidatus Atelocyanobacterium thalassae TaxID=713887 RepID=D3EPG0_ATETH|nr:predicted Zn-dependent peptidase [Candidatus Atelocyanobacterium thalassa isolate ALOHA]|tara:strand:+ start:98284 stop:99816 length:1533 start_codon:yes stop_codon:yes gene_type:complete